MVIAWFLLIHVYAFIAFVLLLSFYIFVAMNQDALFDRNRARSVLKPNIVEQLDNFTSVVHTVHRTALKRKVPWPENDSSDRMRSFYGVKKVDAKRARSLGFRSKLLSYERKEQIYIPEISPDSKRCDLWNEQQDARLLVKCKVAEGEQACFNCIESRKFVRYCVNFTRSIRVHITHGTDVELGDQFIDIEANANKDEGYCLSSVFKNIAHSDGGLRPNDETRNCNPHTGDWLLARLTVLGDSSYNWVCRCRYPNLMTNISTVFSDCMRPVGCRPDGELDDETKQGKTNPYTEGTCVCRKGFAAARDPTIGPVCMPTPIISESNLPQQIYPEYGLSIKHVLKWPEDEQYLDPRVSVISGNNPHGIQLPNPCKYDAFTYEEMSDEEACDLVTEKIDGQYVAYCVMKSTHGLPVRSDRDYLRNNNGQYANACLRVDHLDVPNFYNFILSYQTSRSYETRPDFGVIYFQSSTLSAIKNSVKDDPEYRKFLSFVRPPSSLSPNAYPPLLIVDTSNIEEWFTAYEQVPVTSTKLYGLKKRLVDRWNTPNIAGGVLYNWRQRGFYWYCVDNPLGNVHWNHGTALDLLIMLKLEWPAIVGGAVDTDRASIDLERGFVYRKFQEKSQDFQVSKNNHIRKTIGVKPKEYPTSMWIIPFASGADVDDAAFSREYYPGLYPIFKVEDKKPENVVDMGFVFNTRSDLFDSTLTFHEKDRFLVMAAERIIGEYKNHRTVMRNKMQGSYV